MNSPDIPLLETRAANLADVIYIGNEQYDESHPITVPIKVVLKRNDFIICVINKTLLTIFKKTTSGDGSLWEPLDTHSINEVFTTLIYNEKETFSDILLPKTTMTISTIHSNVFAIDIGMAFDILCKFHLNNATDTTKVIDYKNYCITLVENLTKYNNVDHIVELDYNGKIEYLKEFRNVIDYYANVSVDTTKLDSCADKMILYIILLSFLIRVKKLVTVGAQLVD